jgi:hypothetical protein
LQGGRECGRFISVMRNTNKEAFLANSVVTQRVIELYEAVPNALAMEVRMMERNPEDRDNEMLLPYYKKALELLLAKAA